jgi:CheY-like chemotaxis protein
MKSDSAKIISVLIVEDEAISLLLLCDGFSIDGFKVCATAATGSDAVILAEKSRPDVVIMDIGLAGEMDGLEAAGLIRGKNDTAIIFTTGYNDDELRKKAEEFNPLAFLIKPVEIEELISIIKAAF